MAGIALMFILLLFFTVSLIAGYILLSVTARKVAKHMPIKQDTMQAERFMLGNNVRSKS